MSVPPLEWTCFQGSKDESSIKGARLKKIVTVSTTRLGRRALLEPFRQSLRDNFRLGARAIPATDPDDIIAVRSLDGHLRRVKFVKSKGKDGSHLEKFC